jgi:hypothetical protein
MTIFFTILLFQEFFFPFHDEMVYCPGNDEGKDIQDIRIKQA